MCGWLKFTYEVYKCTAPKLIALNRTMQSPTIACIAKVPFEISAVLSYYTAHRGNLVLVFRDNI